MVSLLGIWYLGEDRTRMGTSGHRGRAIRAKRACSDSHSSGDVSQRPLEKQNAKMISEARERQGPHCLRPESSSTRKKRRVFSETAGDRSLVHCRCHRSLVYCR